MDFTDQAKGQFVVGKAVNIVKLDAWADNLKNIEKIGKSDPMFVVTAQPSGKEIYRMGQI